MQETKILGNAFILTRPITLLPHTPVVQKIADQRWLIANSTKMGTFFI